MGRSLTTPTSSGQVLVLVERVPHQVGTFWVSPWTQVMVRRALVPIRGGNREHWTRLTALPESNRAVH